MKVNHVRQNVFPIVAALIWGTSFVAQSVSADYVEAFTFNTARSLVAFLFLAVLCVIFRKLRKANIGAEEKAITGTIWDLVLGFCSYT